jgi:Na+/melibiose symporter-like transporter
MHVTTVAQLIPVLQTAIGPAILISGVGLLLLGMTNRLGRAIDRARILAWELPVATEAEHVKVSAQLQILWRRARLIRLAIALAAMSALAAAVLIIVLFFTALWQMETAWLISALFIVCMACLIGSLIVFIHDINQSLAALKLEMEAGRRRDV